MSHLEWPHILWPLIALGVALCAALALKLAEKDVMSRLTEEAVDIGGKVASCLTVLLLIALALGILFGIVRLVKWMWTFTF